MLQTLVVWGGLLGWMSGGTAWASEKDCLAQVRAKQFQNAAQCYLQLLGQVETHPVWRKDVPLFKDRFLRHAALSYRLAANQQSRLGVKGYLKEQAIVLLRRSFEKGYCEASQRCRINRLLADQLEQEIQYTPLTIVTDDRRARIQVSGYQFQQERMQHFTKKLRPGEYQITIQHPKRKTQVRKVSLRPEHMITINASEAQVKVLERKIIIAKKIPPLVLAGYISGGILAAFGVVMIVFSVLEQNSLNATYLDPKANQNLSEEEYARRFGTSETTKIVGGVLAGLGGLFVIGGMIAHIAANNATPKRRIEVKVPPIAANGSPISPSGRWAFSRVYE